MAWVVVIGFGVLGVALRFAIDSWIARYSLSFPFGTLLINVTGCFLAGLIFGMLAAKNLSDDLIKLGLVVGFCGGFTTFSGFGLQFMQLFSEGRISSAMIYGIGSPIACIIATAGGLTVTRLI